MSQLFTAPRSPTPGDPAPLEVTPLESARYVLRADADGALRAALPEPGAGPIGSGAYLVRSTPQATDADDALWFVVVSGVNGNTLRLNGDANSQGVRALRHRDELYLDGARAWFSTEGSASVARFEGDRDLACARCADPIEASQWVVSCPDCGTTYHQFEERPCWTFGPRCVSCPQPTALETGFLFTPEGI